MRPWGWRPSQCGAIWGVVWVLIQTVGMGQAAVSRHWQCWTPSPSFVYICDMLNLNVWTLKSILCLCLWHVELSFHTLVRCPQRSTFNTLAKCRLQSSPSVTQVWWPQSIPATWLIRLKSVQFIPPLAFTFACIPGQPFCRARVCIHSPPPSCICCEVRDPSLLSSLAHALSPTACTSNKVCPAFLLLSRTCVRSLAPTILFQGTWLFATLFPHSHPFPNQSPHLQQGAPSLCGSHSHRWAHLLSPTNPASVVRYRVRDPSRPLFPHSSLFPQLPVPSLPCLRD